MILLTLASFQNGMPFILWNTKGGILNNILNKNILTIPVHIDVNYIEKSGQDIL